MFELKFYYTFVICHFEMLLVLHKLCGTDDCITIVVNNKCRSDSPAPFPKIISLAHQ